MENELVVPQGMLDAHVVTWAHTDSHKTGLQAALEWLAKNPPLPAAMVDQVSCMIWSFNLDKRPEIGGESAMWTEEHEAVKRIYRRIAQLACQITFAQAFKPEPAIPKDLADLVIVGALDLSINMSLGGLNALLLEAYSRGKQAQPAELTGSLPVQASRA